DPTSYGVGVSFSPDDHWLADFWLAGTTLELQDLIHLQQPASLLPKLESSSLWSVLFEPESRSLIASGNDGLIRFWNLETFQVALTLRHSNGPHVCFSIAPNGNLLASMDAYGVVKLWEAALRSSLP